MRSLIRSVWLVLFVAEVALAADHEPVLPTTTRPIVYTIDYTDQYFTNPQYLDRFKAAPPDLLHVGKALPITHLWGPVPLYGGENQYTGGPKWTLSRDNIALLTPEAVTQRVEHIRDTLARYHAAGVREITPYISYHTVAGDHEKRLGFWQFYDQWTKYEKWAGPKLEHDPFDWLVVDKKGKFLEGSCGGYTPDYFAPLHRYRACLNHPDWAEWNRRLVGMAADVGYDGCFIDNTHPDPCYCRYCKDTFLRWLAENADQEWVRRFTKGLALDKLTLDTGQTPPELVRRWRLLCAAEYLGKLREVGRKVKPGFTIFPNSGNIHECLTMGSQCDRLMFESTSSPGLLLDADQPFEGKEIAVRVVAKAAQSDRYTYRYVVNDPPTHAAMQADIVLPLEVEVGKSAKFEVRVASVGDTPADNDFAEDFFLHLSDPQNSAETRLKLEPAEAIGGTGAPRKVKQPPVVLQTTWTPDRPGSYVVQFGFRYTDEGHGPKAMHSPHLATLSMSQLCVDHLAELLFTQHMHARTIYLGYEAQKKGWENVQELALAELAAFSGGGGFSGVGQPQALYRAFFQKHPDLFAGYQPTAPAAILYAYWGSNPLSPQPSAGAGIHGRLAASHRPFVALVDASLPVRANELAGFAVLYLESPNYEMSADQLQALRDYATLGRVVLADKDVAINGQPVLELLGSDRVSVWDPAHPTLPTAAVAPFDGIRGNVRFAIYQKANRLAVHVVNHNVCLLDAKKKVLEVDAMPLSIPIPADWKAVSAACYGPGAEPESLPCVTADGVAQLTLPKLHIYKVVLLESR